MNIFRPLTHLALLAALVLPSALSAAEANAHPVAPAIINTTCPMDGNAIDAVKSPTVLITVGEGTNAKQFRLAMCSMACCDDFMKDPATTLKPLFSKNAPGPKTNFK